MGTHAVSIHHRNLDGWLQRGGHFAVEDVSKRAAAREVVEETGFAQFLANGEKNPLFDLDLHLIPAHSDVPEHVHYDVRTLFVAQDAASRKPKTTVNPREAHEGACFA